MKILKNTAALLGFISFCFAPFALFKINQLSGRTAIPPAQISVEVSTNGYVEWQRVAANDVIHVVISDGKLVKVDSMPNN
jgi:hypothetical protein